VTIPVLVAVIGLYIVGIYLYWESVATLRAQCSQAIQFIDSSASESTDTESNYSAMELDEKSLIYGYGPRSLEASESGTYYGPLATLEPSEYEPLNDSQLLNEPEFLAGPKAPLDLETDACFSPIYVDEMPTSSSLRQSRSREASTAAKHTVCGGPIVPQHSSHYQPVKPALAPRWQKHEPNIDRNYQVPTPSSSPLRNPVGQPGRISCTFKAQFPPSPSASSSVEGVAPANRSPHSPVEQMGRVGRTYKVPSTPSTLTESRASSLPDSTRADPGNSVQNLVAAHLDRTALQSPVVVLESASALNGYELRLPRRRAAAAACVALREWARAEKCNRMHSYLENDVLEDDEGLVVQCLRD